MSINTSELYGLLISAVKAGETKVNTPWGAFTLEKGGVNSSNEELFYELLDLLEFIEEPPLFIWFDPKQKGTYLSIEQDGEVSYIYKGSSTFSGSRDVGAIVRAVKVWKQIPSDLKKGVWCQPERERLISFYKLFDEVRIITGFEQLKLHGGDNDGDIPFIYERPSTALRLRS